VPRYRFEVSGSMKLRNGLPRSDMSGWQYSVDWRLVLVPITSQTV
jgi:hypothetical protein